VGGFNERFIRSQDYNLWHRMIECGPIGSVEIVLVQIRKHAGNISLDDKGYLQFKFSVIASTCHFIKSRCGFDPADSKDDKTWQDFLAWVDNRIKMTGIFFNLKSYLNFTANLRTFSFRKILWSFFDLSAILNIFRFITSKVFKKTVGSSLADEWLEKNGHVSGNKISVIMACYNSSDFIEEAINSILEQDFQDFELILIDDCSKDDTFKIITKFKKLDSRIKVAQTKINSGPAVARNIGISLSVYDWIAILDSDDLSMVGRLKDQIKIGVSDRKIVLVGCDAEFFDGSSQINYKYPASSNRMKARLLNGRAFQPHSSMLYRKSALNRVGGFNKRYLQSEDYNLWCRLALLGKFSSVRKPLVRIRKHLNNISLAEGGHKQILYRFLAAISFDLKKELFIDTDYYSDEEWNDFLIWEKERLEFYGFFKYWDKFISAKINIKKSGGLIIGFKYLLFDINFIYLFIVNYFFDRTRKKIAKEWVAHKYRVEQRI
jgi:glycosyltransferase involved in cell wall biosynthesis